MSLKKKYSNEIVLNIPEEKYSKKQLEMFELNYQWCLFKHSIAPKDRTKTRYWTLAEIQKS